MSEIYTLSIRSESIIRLVPMNGARNVSPKLPNNLYLNFLLQNFMEHLHKLGYNELFFFKNRLDFWICLCWFNKLFELPFQLIYFLGEHLVLYLQLLYLIVVKLEDIVDGVCIDVELLVKFLGRVLNLCQ